MSESIYEELKSKLGFHNQCPYSCIRIFYCAIDPSFVGKCRDAARDSLDEYDRLMLAGKGAKMHRVAHRIMGADTECRRQLVAFGRERLGATLKDFPVAYVTIMQYACIPLVGRRVESVHHVIKEIGQEAKNVRPPYISAAVSAPQHIERLRTCPDFHKFVSAKWRSKTLLDQVLHLLVDKQDLRAMTSEQKLRRAYQCSLEDEFRDMTNEREAQENFLRQSAHTRSTVMDLPASWKAGLSYLKTRLMAGEVFSLPADLFTLAANGTGPGSDFNWQAADPWADSLASAALPQIQFDMQAVPNCVFFQSVCPRPEKRHNVVLHHQDRCLDVVSVVRRSVVDYVVEQRRVSLLSVKHSPETIRLLPLLARTTDLLKSFFIWRPAAFGVAEVDRMPLADIQTATDPFPMILPSASEVLELAIPSAGQQAASVASGSRLRNLSDEAVASNLLLIGRALRASASESVPFLALQDVHMDDLLELEQKGVVALTEDEFGELQVSRIESGIKFTSWQLMCNPIQVAHGTSYSLTSKLDLALALVRDGWRAKDTVRVAAFAPNGAKEFLRDHRRPNSYFHCLIEWERLFAKGVPHIHHKWKDFRHEFSTSVYPFSRPPHPVFGFWPQGGSGAGVGGLGRDRR